MKKLRCMFFDVSAFSHAAWHSYPAKIGPDGFCYRVVHGVFSKLHKLNNQFEWDHLVAVLDPEGGSVYRKSIYPEYKANRPAQDEDFIRQKRLIKEALESSGIYCLQSPGVESDDIIGSLSAKASIGGHASLIVSPDKDLLQLVSDNVGIIKPLKKVPIGGIDFEYINKQNVIDMLGIEPMQMADWLSLVGDTSDNIPGVAGIGKVKATELLQKYGSLEYLMMHSGELPDKLKKKIEEVKPLLPTIKLLTSIRCDEPVPDVEFWVKNRNEEKFEQIKRQMSMPEYFGKWL